MALASQLLVSEWLLAKSILTKKYGTRTKRDISSIVPWLRNRGEIFTSLSEDVLEDLAQNVILMRYTTNNVISQQGDRGSSLYFILRGKVTIYIDPNSVDKGNHKELLAQNSSQYFSHATSSKKPKSSSQKNKNSFGVDVRCLVTGNCFNESAVITREGILIYTIITDEPTDCILIGKKLFDRTLSEKFKLDTLSKLEFAATLAHNCNWAPNAIMHLALSVWEETYPFGSFITTEGKEINSLYAIKSGIVKLSVDPSKDVPNEVLNLITPPQNHLVDILCKSKQLTNEESERQRKAHVQYHLSHLQHSVKQIRKTYPSMLKNKANICILGPGDFIGSTEALFRINFSNFTAICDSPVTVYCLDHINFQTWISKRYPSSARHMHLVNQTILVEWASRLRGAAILSCLLALTNQELTQTQHGLAKRKFMKKYGGVKDGYSPKQLALRIARSVATFSWNQEEISRLTKDAELTDSAFFSQPFTSSCLQTASSDTLSRWKDIATCRPFTAPSKLTLESGIISSWSLASVDKSKKHFQPCFDHPLSKPHKRISPQEAFTIPIPSPYSCFNQEQGVILEENCKLGDSVCTELSQSLEDIHDNNTSLTTVTPLPDSYVNSKVDLQDKGRPYQTSNTLQCRDSVLNNATPVFTPPTIEHSLLSGGASLYTHHKAHSDPRQWTTIYPATPANSPIKRSIKSAGSQFRVSSAMHTPLSDNTITPVMEESLSSSSNETVLEEIEIRDPVEEPKLQGEPNPPVNPVASHLSMQQFMFPQAGRPISNKLHRPKKSPVSFPPAKSSRIPHPSMIAMYMEQRASLPQPLFKTALNYCSTIPDKLDYQRSHHTNNNNTSL